MGHIDVGQYSTCNLEAITHLPTIVLYQVFYSEAKWFEFEARDRYRACLTTRGKE
jgi:hypothetical protein